MAATALPPLSLHLFDASHLRQPRTTPSTSKQQHHQQSRWSNHSNTVRHSRRYRNTTIFNLLHHRALCSIRTRDEPPPMAAASNQSRNLHPHNA
ncbi:hypothetical protein DEO72_LG2g2757 [Vigna unguiculata]|uniref:Uncharacterized protein n=1 Tax=Vigna unguiculata TaxID=3917 RepID=A0A4D6L1Q3_VIGUN|nr:hypothetical protein DEO72_LG2g2757 [Vigna unguiculata]